MVSAIHHSTCDAVGMAVIFKLWGDQCRMLSQNLGTISGSIPQLPAANWDRSLLSQFWSKTAVDYPAANVDPGVWPLIGLDRSLREKGPYPIARSRLPVREQTMSTRVFYMSSSTFMKLRAKVNKESGTMDLSGVFLLFLVCIFTILSINTDFNIPTGNDVLVALLWQNLMKARIAARRNSNATVDMKSQVELQVAQDARPYFAEGLPPFYMGNCVVHLRPSLMLQELIGPDAKLSFVAKRIRECAMGVNQEKVMDAYMLLKQMPDYNQIHPIRFLTVPDTFTISSLLLLPEDITSFGGSLLTNDGCAEGSRPLVCGHMSIFPY